MVKTLPLNTPLSFMTFMLRKGYYNLVSDVFSDLVDALSLTQSRWMVWFVLLSLGKWTCPAVVICYRYPRVWSVHRRGSRGVLEPRQLGVVDERARVCASPPGLRHVRRQPAG